MKYRNYRSVTSPLTLLDYDPELPLNRMPEATYDLPEDGWPSA